VACNTPTSDGLRRRGAQGAGCQRAVRGELLLGRADSDGTRLGFARHCPAKRGETSSDWGKRWALIAGPHVAVKEKERNGDADAWAAAAQVRGLADAWAAAQ
jgi:hypothetical protein